MALVRLAEETERELGGAEDAQGGGESAASAVAMEDIPRINFGLGGFMRVKSSAEYSSSRRATARRS